MTSGNDDLTLKSVGLEVNNESIQVFFAMLAAAQARYPSGLPDIELQNVFDCHQAWLAAHVSCPKAYQSDRQAVDTQSGDGSHPPHLRIVSSGRS